MKLRLRLGVSAGVAVICSWLASSAATAQTNGPADPAAKPAPTVSLPASPDSEAARTSVAAKPVEPPLDPTAAAAYAVLEKHCARCHQAGRLAQPTAAGFQNILRLDEIVRDPALVMPGNPDASRVYLSILRRTMPSDSQSHGGSAADVEAEELARVRAWIKGLSPGFAAPTCSDRFPLDRGNVAQAVEASIAAVGETAKRKRFISIAHLGSACASAEEMRSHRDAIAKLFNMFSWKTDRVKVDQVDEAGTVLRIDLDELGWVPAHWDRIVKASPQPAALMPKLSQAALDAVGTPVPVVHGDWLASVAMAPPLYYDLLALPVVTPEVARILQVNPDAARRTNALLRGVVRGSRFSRSVRYVERLPTHHGEIWTAYDLARREGRPEDLVPSFAVTGHDAALSMFTLPNGLPAFFAANARGERIDQVPDGIQHVAVAGRTPLRAGAQCLGCHQAGPVPLPQEKSTPADLQAAAGRDEEAAKRAAAKLGLARDELSAEPVQRLARRFTEPLTLERAAAELMVEPSRLRAAADGDGVMARLIRRLAVGSIGRAEFTSVASALSVAGGDGGRADAAQGEPAPAAAPASGPGLVIVPDRLAYSAGDRIQLTVGAGIDCHLTLINIDGRGRGTVLFPSDFEQNNRITADRAILLPAERAPYTFRLRERGRETIVAICNPAGPGVDGIRHDFERQRFTDLGDYAAFIGQAYTAERAVPAPATAQTPGLAATKARPPRGAGARNGSTAAKPGTPTLLETAIVIDVR